MVWLVASPFGVLANGSSGSITKLIIGFFYCYSLQDLVLQPGLNLGSGSSGIVNCWIASEFSKYQYNCLRQSDTSYSYIYAHHRYISIY